MFDDFSAPPAQQRRRSFPNWARAKSCRPDGESQYAGTIIVNQGTFQLNGATGIADLNCVSLQLDGGTFVSRQHAERHRQSSHLNDQAALTFNGGAFTMQAPAGKGSRNEIGQHHQFQRAATAKSR